jgi:hypothetical protein
MERLYKKGLVTTLIGLLILIFSGTMIWTGKEGAEAMSGWIALGLMFLRSKDSLIGLSKKEDI